MWELHIIEPGKHSCNFHIHLLTYVYYYADPYFGDKLEPLIPMAIKAPGKDGEFHDLLEKMQKSQLEKR